MKRPAILITKSNCSQWYRSGNRIHRTPGSRNCLNCTKISMTDIKVILLNNLKIEKTAYLGTGQDKNKPDMAFIPEISAGHPTAMQSIDHPTLYQYLNMSHFYLETGPAPTSDQKLCVS